ncbi:hypothetical protein Q1695_001074 [Nippostrongylus brasiliensis]|nr:hypothetical protein Q1695_001074 [Nippostrongylus brasiliensis]
MTAPNSPHYFEIRRKISSRVGAGPHPMAVALAPVPKIDYSVTKGGARTWTVLLVFLFLCSGLYTIFSSKDHKDAEHSTVDTKTVVDDNDYEEVTTTTRSRDDSDYDQAHSPSTSKQIDDEDDDIDKSPLEDKLFEGLRRKIESNILKVKEYVKGHEDGDGDEDDDSKHQPVSQKKVKRKKQKPAHAQEKVEPSTHRSKTLKKRGATIVEEKDHEEDDDDDNDDDDGDDDVKVDDAKSDESAEEHAAASMEESTEEEEDDDDKEEAKADTDRRHVRRKTHTSRHLMVDSVPERQCKRKHCPPSYQAEPRRYLLKKKYKNVRGVEDEDDAEITIEDDDDDNEDEDDDDDDEVTKLPSKPSEVVALNKHRSAGREAYKRRAITNRDDHRYRDALDHADNLVEKHDYDAAFAIFDKILRARPDSPRAHFGKARGFQLRGEMDSNDSDFSLAVNEYEQVLQNAEAPDSLLRQAASRLIELSSFKGDFYRSLRTHQLLADRFPDEMEHRTNVALTFMKMKRLQDAKKVLLDILENDHNNGLAHAYYGYILKVADDNLEQGVAYMKKGLRLGAHDITDAKFYYQLGHGLMYLGRSTEAYNVFEHAASLGLFLSAQQRSIYNVEGLTGRAWWTSEQTGYAKHLKAVERQWVSIRAEAAKILQSAPDLWREENPTITVDGRWIAFPLLENGHFNSHNCEMAPQTCAILREFRESSNASKTEMRFSALSSGAQILPHCGPTNSRLQAHLGLIVPSEARIRVGTEQRGWKTGKFIIFDDSFEHELQFDGASSASLRLILLIDLWHPDVESRQRIIPEDD